MLLAYVESCSADNLMGHWGHESHQILEYSSVSGSGDFLFEVTYNGFLFAYRHPVCFRGQTRWVPLGMLFDKMQSDD